MANHFLYDSPIGNVNLFSALLTVAVLLPVIVFLKDCDEGGAADNASGEYSGLVK
jgi:hypothetical protein